MLLLVYIGFSICVEMNYTYSINHKFIYFLLFFILSFYVTHFAKKKKTNKK